VALRIGRFAMARNWAFTSLTFYNCCSRSFRAFNDRYFMLQWYWENVQRLNVINWMIKSYDLMSLLYFYDVIMFHKTGQLVLIVEQFSYFFGRVTCFLSKKDQLMYIFVIQYHKFVMHIRIFFRGQQWTLNHFRLYFFVWIRSTMKLEVPI
jgi:hypothetical protein